MKFISSHSSRLIASYSADEIRPESGIVPGDIVKAIADRYQFLVVPTLADLNKENFKSMTFRGGGVTSGRRKIEILELTILEGGIVVDATNSDDCEFVLEDLIAWATPTFGLRSPSTPPKLMFLSAVIVELDENISTRMDAFAEISSLLTSALATHTGINGSFDYSRLAFNCDPTLLPQGSLRTEFLIERRVGQPYSESRFFCHAPFRTRLLVDLLEKIEALLARG
jgi:hypothetical protein